MFFQNRGRAWAELASSLSRIDRPDAAAVEAVLMESSNALPTVFNIPPPPSIVHMPSVKAVGEVPVVKLEESPALGIARVAGLVKKVDPSQQELVSKLASAIGAVKKPESKIKESNGNKSVEVDGVMYTSSEVLTSLDAKIKSSAPPENPIAVSDAKVLLNGDLNPMPPREFSREFESRFQKTSR
jgi:hypothetical protein